MATIPEPLIWEIVKKNNAFLVKQYSSGTNKVVFSREPNNLYNLNSYKYSGKKVPMSVCFLLNHTHTYTYMLNRSWCIFFVWSILYPDCKITGLANKKTVSILPGDKDLNVNLVTTKTKKQNKPSNLRNRTELKKEFFKMAKIVKSQV